MFSQYGLFDYADLKRNWLKNTFRPETSVLFKLPRTSSSLVPRSNTENSLQRSLVVLPSGYGVACCKLFAC